MRTSLTRRTVLQGGSAAILAAALSSFPRARLTRAQGSAAYDVIDLGLFDLEVTEGNLTGFGTIAAMNQDGVVCGRIGVEANRFSPSTWNPDGKLKRLKSGQAGGAAQAINANGDVVGIESVDATYFRPMLWQDGERILLPDLTGSTDSAWGNAHDINDDGIITGYVKDGDVDLSVRWVDGIAETLPAPPSGYSSSYTGSGTRPSSKINARGTIFSSVARDGAEQGAPPSYALWRDDEATILLLPDEVVGGMWLFGNDLNDEDIVLFSAAAQGAEGIWFMFTIDGDEVTMYDQREAGVHSIGLSLNSQGEIVGQTVDAENNTVAAIWRDGEMTVLEELMPQDTGLRFNRPRAINDAGMIVGEALDAEEVTHGILLVPVE